MMEEDDVVNFRLCVEHNKQIEGFCRDHQTDVCSYCVAVTHVVCNVHSWGQQLNKEAELLSKQLFKATFVKQKLTSMLTNTSQNIQDVKEELKTIIQDALKSLENQLLKSLDTACTEQFSVIEQTNERCSEDASKAEAELQELASLRNAPYEDVLEGIEKTKEVRRKLQLSVLEADSCGSLDVVKVRILERVKKRNAIQLHELHKNLFTLGPNSRDSKGAESESNDAGTQPDADATTEGHIQPKTTLLSASESQTAPRTTTLLASDGQTAHRTTSLSASVLSSFEFISLTEASLPSTDEELTVRRKNQPSSLKLVAGFDAKRPTDTMQCWLTGATYLYDGRIVLADYNNGKLKLFSSDLKFCDSIPLDNKPFDVTETDPGIVAVTLPEAFKVVMLEVSDIFTKKPTSSEINTVQPCKGVTYDDGKLYVVCEITYSKSLGCIKVYNSNGDIINHIVQTEGGYMAFLGSLHVAICPKTKQLYFRELSWVATMSLCCITEDGDSPWGSKSFVVNGIPFGLAATEDGVFLADNMSRILWVDGKTGTSYGLKHVHRDYFSPFAVALNRHASQLLVTNSFVLNTDDNNVVQVFEIERDD